MNGLAPDSHERVVCDSRGDGSLSGHALCPGRKGSLHWTPVPTRGRDVGNGPLVGTAGDRLSETNQGSPSSAVSFHLGGILIYRRSVIIPQMVASAHWLLSQAHTPNV